MVGEERVTVRFVTFRPFVDAVPNLVHRPFDQPLEDVFYNGSK